MPMRLRRQRTRGWRMPAGAVYVGRSRGGAEIPTRGAVFQWAQRYGCWGNPYRVPADGTPPEVVAKFIALYEDDPAYRAAVWAHLRGKDLLCWCKVGEACHGAVLLTWANM